MTVPPLFAVPVEWFTLWFNMPFMLLLSDIRQGIFYAFLLCFWIIFTGEHMMVRTEISLYFLTQSKTIYTFSSSSANATRNVNLIWLKCKCCLLASYPWI